ncbi:hypothetical protein F5B20DRAFT_398521 [Whalleya microplaca]|nr:hypothetical protein F5B20DRAFT_398521 [Whalleya microplaca]
MSNSATFSYAQAAKGQSAAQPAGAQSNTTPNQASSTTSTQIRDAGYTPSTRAPSVAVSTTSNEIDASQSTRSSSVKPESSSLSHTDVDAKSTSDEASLPAKSTTEASYLSDQGAEKLPAEVGPQGAERQGRSGNPSVHVTDAGDSKKGRKGKKGKATEKESEQEQDQDKTNPPPKLELSEAPIPTVNIWTQRIEAQAAKTKAVLPVVSQIRGSNNAAVSQPEGASSAIAQNPKQRPLQNGGIDSTGAYSRSLSSGVKAVKKDSEQPRSNGNQASRRNGPRGARTQDRADRPAFEPLTSISNNTASWPTPETAAAVESKTQIQSEKSERSERSEKSEKDEKEESGPSKPRQKKEWVHVPFVPTVNFQTPLPTRGSRGGRTGPSRGGREGVARGGNNAGAQGPTDGSAASRATSAAPVSKRMSVDMSIPRDARKTQTQVEGTKSSAEVTGTNSKVDASNQGQADFISGVGSQDPVARSAGLGQRADDGTKASESVKDNSFYGQNGGYRNGHDRARGGTRGRGNHSASNGVTHPHSQFAHGSGYTFTPNGSMRQPSNPYASGYPQMPFNGSFPAQTTGNYHRSRPGSMSSRPQGNGRHAAGRMPSLPAINVPFDIYSHGNGNFPYVDHSSIMSLVLSQLEYYFSIDNLCKDWHLRKHMDSQGFVLLHVISSFKRMQELAPDYGIIRMACDSSPLIQLVVGEDGQDRVRRHEQWEHWVLEPSDRHPSAQNDVPVSWHPYAHIQHMDPRMMQSPYAVQSPPMFSPTGVDPNAAHYMNGMNGFHGNHMVSPTSNGINGQVPYPESQLSATVPEFSPTGNIGIASSEDVASSESSNNLKLANNGKINKSPASLDAQLGSLPNGSSHKVNDIEHVAQADQPSTNGVNGHHETEGY